MRRATYLLSGILILLLTPPTAWARDRGGNNFTLQVNKAGTGSGTVTSNPSGINCGSTCSAKFASGATVTLTAAPAAGSVFAGWSGSGCTGTGSCTVTLTANTTVTATFNTSGGGGGGTFTLTVTKSGDGTGVVSTSPAGIDCGGTCSASFPAGTTITLFAGPLQGQFSGWSGSGCSGVGNCVLTLNANTTVNASFTIPQLQILTTTMPDGNVGASYSAYITSTGGLGTPHKFKIISGGLPRGLTMAESFGVNSTIVSGTPSQTGTSAFTVQVTDGTGHTATQALSITINGATPLVITVPGPTATSGTVGVAYSQNLFADGGKTPYSWSSTGGQVPPGLGFVSASNGNRLQGTPTTRGTFTFTLTVKDSGGQTTTQQTTITIN